MTVKVAGGAGTNQALELLERVGPWRSILGEIRPPHGEPPEDWATPVEELFLESLHLERVIEGDGDAASLAVDREIQPRSRISRSSLAT